MTDLKKEISRLEKMDYEEKFEGIVRVALERNELIKLLSGEDEYVYDSSGKAWLAPLSGFGPNANLIDMDRISYMVTRLCNDFGSETVKSVLVSALTEMLGGTVKQFYYAVWVYCHLSSFEADQSSNFAQYYITKRSFAREFHPVVFSAVQTRKKELQQTKIEYIGFLDNLYEWCENRSEELVSDGFSSITEA